MADRHLIIAGQRRAGSTLFYNMLRHCLRDFHLPDGEMSAVALRDRTGNVCTKRPFDILQMPQLVAAFGGRKQLDLIVTLRDPRDILTSRHRAITSTAPIVATRSTPTGRLRSPRPGSCRCTRGSWTPPGPAFFRRASST